MDNLREIVHFQIEEYGNVRIKLAEVMDSRGITRNRLCKLTGSRYDVVTRYYRGDNVQMADLDFIARVCYVLDCRIEDLLEYQKHS